MLKQFLCLSVILTLFSANAFAKLPGETERETLTFEFLGAGDKLVLTSLANVTDSDGTFHRWRLRNPTDDPITVYYSFYGSYEMSDPIIVPANTDLLFSTATGGTLVIYEEGTGNQITTKASNNKQISIPIDGGLSLLLLGGIGLGAARLRKNQCQS